MRNPLNLHSTKTLLFSIDIFTISLFLSVNGSWAADFCVSNATELQARLTDSQSNGQDDTIKITRGTYNGNFTFNSSEGHSITLLGGYNAGCTTRNVNPENTVLDAQSSGRVLYLYNTDGGDIIVDGVTIRNGNGSEGDQGAGVYLRSDKPGSGDAGDITLANNIIKGNTANGNLSYGGGVYIHSKADDGTSAKIIISYNTITGNTTYWGGGGVYAKTESVSGGNSGEITVTNNIIAENTVTTLDGGGMYIDSDVAMEGFTCGDTYICNNTVTGNQARIGGGINLNMYNGMGRFYNNIIWGNSADNGDDLNLGTYLGNAKFYGYNNDYSEMYSYSWTNSGNNIDEDPLFANLSAGNYHLKGNSPCINAGIYAKKTYIPEIPQWVIYNYSFIPDDDFEGDSRDSNWIEVTTNNYYKYCDIGADEYTPASLPHVPLLLLNN